MAANLQQQIEFLRGYTACDVSDALLKLQSPQGLNHGGFLADLVPFAPKSPLQGDIDEQPKIIAPASTLLQVPREDNSPPDPNAVPSGSHWVDLTEKGTIVVISQPLDHTCAAIGGIMGFKMKAQGVEGVVVSGRVRDLAELRSSKLPVWARAKSTVGTQGQSKVKARNVPVNIRGVTVSPGDIIFCDPLEGVVSIPKDLLDDVINLMPKLVEADDKVKEAAENGMSIYEAFKKYRGGH